MSRALQTPSKILTNKELLEKKIKDLEVPKLTLGDLIKAYGEIMKQEFQPTTLYLSQDAYIAFKEYFSESNQTAKR